MSIFAVMAEMNFNYVKGFTFSKHIEKDISDFERVFGVFNLYVYKFSS